MKSISLNKLLPSALLFLALATLDGGAQTLNAPAVEPVNSNISQNPKKINKIENSENKNQTSAAVEEIRPTGTTKIQGEADITGATIEPELYPAAVKTPEIAKRTAALPPTEIYKIGFGDVLFISLQNAPSRASTYFTVLNDGTIDYPLAGEMISVAGLTSQEIEDLLRRKIKLYENPQISVRVREYSSHSIKVLGLVERAGEKYLQREAVPLYVIKAEAIVESRAALVFVKRTGKTAAEIIDLRDPKSDDFLIFSGDILEFKSNENITVNRPPIEQVPQFYYIGGEIESGGQKDFYAGISLTQAILASGGLRKSDAKRVIIRRKNQSGLLSTFEFDLNAIKDGLQLDPLLQPGDTIEILK
ncbi:MAG: polysaccharide biosynthesis/export family protein [Acidobacteria bacterium]|nr:polysaccharide biosynthesis/export family protein [Acidobacteriota bacterium]